MVLPKRYGVTRHHELADIIRQVADSEAESYDAEPWHAELAKDLVAAATKYSPKSFEHDTIKVLDACCGTGAVAFAAKEVIGPNTIVHGIDFSEKSIQIAKKKAAGDSSMKFFVKSTVDIRKAPLSELEHESYDLITIGNSFFMLKDGLWAFQEFVELLKPGGAIVFDIPQPKTQNIANAFMVALSEVMPEDHAVIDRKWIKGDSSIRSLLSLTELKTLKVLETKNYKTDEYKWTALTDIFDSAIESIPYLQGDKLDKYQKADARNEFIHEMRSALIVDDVIFDEYKFFIGVAAKAGLDEPKGPTSPMNNFNPIYEKIAHFLKN